MNKSIGFQLIAYSLLLVGLSFLTHYLAPPIARVTLIAGMVGAPICLAWGLRAVLGNRGRALPILTLIPIVFVMLSQMVLTWGGSEAAGQRAGALVITVLFALSLGMLMRIAYAGVVFDVQPSEPAKGGSIPPPAAKQPAANR